jgi:adenine C2-methylase RlmN of 23S rRNA A2503 and tRNA A37
VLNVTLQPLLTSIVFMGLGEPLNNVIAVKTVLEQLTNPHMFAIGKTHISVSTVGPSPHSIRYVLIACVNSYVLCHCVIEYMRSECISQCMQLCVFSITVSSSSRWCCLVEQ